MSWRLSVGGFYRVQRRNNYKSLIFNLLILYLKRFSDPLDALSKILLQNSKNQKSIMKKHTFLAVAASVMLSLQPAEAHSAASSCTSALSEDIGPSVFTQLRPTVPPHAPRFFDTLPMMAGRFAGSGLVLAIPQGTGETDIFLTDLGTGTVFTLSLAPGVHFIPFSSSDDPVRIQAVTEQGVTYDGILGE